jgi:hypothetical protein
MGRGGRRVEVCSYKAFISTEGLGAEKEKLQNSKPLKILNSATVIA